MTREDGWLLACTAVTSVIVVLLVILVFAVAWQP
jgi:hypothetical protein